MQSDDLHLRLKRCREDAGMSQEELAEKLFVHRTYISQVERGIISRPLTYEFVKRWGQATNRLEMIGIDFFESKPDWKQQMVYKMVISAIKSDLEMLETATG